MDISEHWVDELRRDRSNGYDVAECDWPRFLANQPSSTQIEIGTKSLPDTRDGAVRGEVVLELDDPERASRDHRTFFRSAIIWLDDDADWFVETARSNHISLPGTLTHEFGHVLGIFHARSLSTGCHPTPTMWEDFENDGSHLETVESADIGALEYFYNRRWHDLRQFAEMTGDCFTATSFRELEAVDLGASTVVRWKSAYLYAAQTFRILASDDPDGPWTQVGELPAEVPFLSSSSDFSLVVPSVHSWWIVQEINTSGRINTISDPFPLVPIARGRANDEQPLMRTNGPARGVAQEPGLHQRIAPGVFAPVASNEVQADYLFFVPSDRVKLVIALEEVYGHLESREQSFLFYFGSDGSNGSVTAVVEEVLNDGVGTLWIAPKPVLVLAADVHLVDTHQFDVDETGYMRPSDFDLGFLDPENPTLDEPYLRVVRIPGDSTEEMERYAGNWSHTIDRVPEVIMVEGDQLPNGSPIEAFGRILEEAVPAVEAAGLEIAGFLTQGESTVTQTRDAYVDLLNQTPYVLRLAGGGRAAFDHFSARVPDLSATVANGRWDSSLCEPSVTVALEATCQSAGVQNDEGESTVSEFLLFEDPNRCSAAAVIGSMDGLHEAYHELMLRWGIEALTTGRAMSTLDLLYDTVHSLEEKYEYLVFDALRTYTHLGLPVEFPWSPISVADSEVSIPTGLWVGVGFPNPGGRGATVPFEISADGEVLARVYDVSGRLVQTPLADESLAGGRHVVTWDGKDRSGRRVSPGVYFLRVSWNGESRARKVHVYH